MSTAQLIEDIVRRVLAETGGCSARKDPRPATGPCVMVLSTEKNTDIPGLKGLLPSDASMIFLPESGPLSVEKIGQHDTLVLPFVPLKTLADLALGRAGGRTGGLVTQLLMAGHEIKAAAFEHDRYADTAPPAMIRLYREYETRLGEFGLTRLGSLPEDEKKERIIRERLVTEQKIAELAAQGTQTIITAQGCLITALARDLAREKGIRLITGDHTGEGRAK